MTSTASSYYLPYMFYFNLNVSATRDRKTSNLTHFSSSMVPQIFHVFSIHCVKDAQVWVFSDPYFSVLKWENTS